MASISEPFIRRPVGTTLLAIGLFLVGIVAYVFLPVSSVPNVDFPMIRVSATRPGADPSVMASTVAAPLERRLGQIAGIDQITSTSSLGTTSIQLQFSIGRDIDRAARDVQAAINASLADLPSDLPSLPRFRKANPSAAPVFVLALTSKTLTTSAMYDVADTVIAQRISQVPGVGEVTVSGADQPAVRIALNPVALSNAGYRDRRRAARHHQRQSAGAGRHLQRRPPERDDFDQQADAHRGRIPRHHHQELGRQFRPPRRRRRRRGFRPQQPLDRLVQQAAGGPDPDHQAGRRQRDRHRRPGEGADPGTEAMAAGRRRDFDAGRPHRHHPRQRARHAVHAAGDRLPGDGGGVRLPAAADADDRGRRLGAAGAGRHLRRHVARRILDRQSVADGARDLGRLRGRRRHRHDREHVPQPRTGHGAVSGGARGRQADRLYRAVDQPVADRGVYAADLHGRDRRPAVARILADADLCHRGVDRGLAHGHADDLRALHQGGDVRPRDLVRSPGRGHAVAHRLLLHLDAAGGAGLPVPDPARVLCHHRADGGALYQDAEGLFPDRRQRVRDRRDARIPRHLVPGDARAAAATGRHRDGRSGRGRHRLLARRHRRPGRRRFQPRHHVHQPEAAGGAGRACRRRR